MPSSRVADLKWMITAATEGLEVQMREDGTQDAKMVELLAKYRTELAELTAKGIDRPGIESGNVTAGTGTPLSLTDRPAAGTAASNQYGTFQVHYASPKQTAFIKALMDRKDLTALEGSVTIDVARLREQVAKTQVNKKAASAIIDRLLALPDAAPVAQAAPAAKPAARRNRYGAKCIRCNVWIEAEGGLLAKDANGKWAADHEGDCPAKAATPTRRELTRDDAGVYVLPNGDLVRVYFGQQSGRMLAKKATPTGLEYVGQADRVLVEGSRRATAEETGAWGKTTGTCACCGLALDDPESVDRGIGPVCYAKYF